MGVAPVICRTADKPDGPAAARSIEAGTRGAMEHSRHYTTAQANALRPWVAERVRRLRATRAELKRMRPAAEPAVTSDGGRWPGRRYATAAVIQLLTLEELDRREVIVRDPDRGLVDFPALRHGGEVYLCWFISEPEVGHWHALEAGVRGRRPLR